MPVNGEGVKDMVLNSFFCVREPLINEIVAIFGLNFYFLLVGEICFEQLPALYSHFH